MTDLFPRLGRAHGRNPLTQERFTGPEWIFERKFDGIRLLAFKQGGDVRLLSRNRLPQNLPAVAQAIVRDKTGVGMMDCKKALVETEGDIEAAVEWLRAKGISKAGVPAGCGRIRDARARSARGSRPPAQREVAGR